MVGEPETSGPQVGSDPIIFHRYSSNVLLKLLMDGIVRKMFLAMESKPRFKRSS